MKHTFQDLVETFAVLRGPNGCPWDKKQTHETLIQCLKNESQELIEAIEKKDVENMKEELGDVLLQVLIHSQIARSLATRSFLQVSPQSPRRCRSKS